MSARRRPFQLLLCFAILCGAARADLINTIPFSLIGSPNQQTIQVPQFDPALGTLTSATITVTGSLQFALEVFDTGPGAVSVTARDTLSFGGTPLLAVGSFTSPIPANQPVFTFTPDPVSLGTLQESFGANASFLIGTGTLPFDLVLANATVDQFSGPNVSSVLAFAGASGNVTAAYAFTPAAAPVPEPNFFFAAGLALVALLWRITVSSRSPDKCNRRC